MKTMFNLFVSILFLFVLSGCVRNLKDTEPEQKPAEIRQLAGGASGNADSTLRGDPPGEADMLSLLRTLDELSELERSGAWIQGLALTESGLREKAGDYAGAVAAAYKELSWAYGFGLIQKSDLKNGLTNVLGINNDEKIISAANSILAFINEKWDEALAGLEILFAEADEPDSFASWMMLVCALEKNKDALGNEYRRSGAAYKSIRARYAQFPEYWYRGARAFSGVISAEFAENCINTSSQGPFAKECRSILASYTGLKTDDSGSIMTKKEIESVISKAINSNDPNILNSLLPLISLPDNPYTVYAVGTLKALTSVQVFRDYLNKQASLARGRLAERLTYICQG